MLPHDRLTFIRNRYRVYELRVFRDLVEQYFARSARDPDGVPVDWDGAQSIRSRINQMLPRIVQIVRAAGIGAPGSATDPGIAGLGRIDVLQRIFAARYADGLEQEIYDVLDMALGVYDGDRLVALARTLNPLHYAGLALDFIGRAPRWFFRALGFRGRDGTRLRSQDVARLESVAARLSDAETLIETRLADLQDRQALRQADLSRQLAELAERVDFAERVLAQRHSPKLPAPDEHDIVTPV